MHGAPEASTVPRRLPAAEVPSRDAALRRLHARDRRTGYLRAGAERPLGLAVLDELREVPLKREDESGLIFISCDSLPQVFIAVKDEASVRGAIDTCLKNAFEPGGVIAHVFTNGSVSGPIINTVVKLVK